MVPRAMRCTSTYVLVVISPATMQVPVVTSTSHGTRPVGSSVSTASSTASEIWSAILSGWPSVTDSEVKRNRRESAKVVLPTGYDLFQFNTRLVPFEPAALALWGRRFRLPGPGMPGPYERSAILIPVVVRLVRPVHRHAQIRRLAFAEP